MSNAKPVYRNGNGSSLSVTNIVPIVVAVVALGVTLMTTLGGFATFRDYLSIREFSQYKDLVDSQRMEIDRRLERLTVLIDGISIEQKMRASHGSVISALEQRLNAQAARIQEVERKFSSSYSIGDEVKRLEAEIRFLRGQLTAPKVSNGKAH